MLASLHSYFFFFSQVKPENQHELVVKLVVKLTSIAAHLSKLSKLRKLSIAAIGIASLA